MKNNCINLDPKEMLPEERLDALADVLAEGIVYLGQRGLLDFVPVPSMEVQETALGKNHCSPDKVEDVEGLPITAVTRAYNART